MTQEELAEKLNVTRQAISSWERERTEPEELIYETKEKSKKINVTTKVSESTVGFGSVLAIGISLLKWHSIKWAILHGVFGWGYVIYYIIKYGWNV